MAIGLAGFASMASMRACDSVLPALASGFSATTSAAAQTISGFAIAYGVMQFFLGPLGDRLGKPRVIGWAVMACACANVGIALSDSLDAIIAGRVLAGAAGGGIVPLSLAHIGDTVTYERRQVALSRLLLATISGMVAGQWLGGVIAQAWGWQWVFAVLAVLFGAASLALFWTGRQLRGPSAGSAGQASIAKGHIPSPGLLRQMQTLVSLRWTRRVLITVALEGAIAMAGFTFVPTYMHERFGLSLAAAGGIMAFFGLGGLIYAVFAPWIIRRLGERGMALGGGVGLGLSMACLAWSPDWSWAPAACLLGGLSFYLLHNTLQANATQMHPAMRGTAVSLFASSLFCGQSLGVVAAAWIADLGSLRAVFALSAVLLPLLGAWFWQGLSLRDEWQSAQAGITAHPPS
ncbi:MAG: hypothetical protein RI949_724 [Pseudomonadota bacterium]|jgi:predicted MFS family arabinose efflux permease